MKKINYLFVGDVGEFNGRMFLNQIKIYGVIIYHFRIGDKKVMKDGPTSKDICAELND